MALPDKFRSLFPKRRAVPPSLKTLQRCPTDYGERHLIEYDIEPGERVKALLLLPKRLQEKCPAIVASHQHNGEYALGKSEPAGLAGDPMAAYGVELCREGFIVLCPDHDGFEDRQQKKRSDLYPLEGKAYETFLFTSQLLKGSHLAAKYLFDLCQAVDALTQYSQVDAERIGAIGHSLGGQMTLWLAAYDPRIKAAFASCGFSTLEAIQRRGFPHNLALYLPGMLHVGDFDEVVASVAPRAFGMCHGLQDAPFPIEGVRLIHERAAGHFPEHNLLKILMEGGHEFPHPARQEAYAFLKAQLMHVG